LSEVSFLQKGKGKDLVFLHGYLSSKESFAYQIGYFSRFYRVTAVDFLGFGKSGKLPSAYSVDDYAKWLEETLRLLQVKNPHIIAHSFGCRVAVKLLSQGYEADKVLLTGPAGVILKRGLSYRLKVRIYRFVKRFAPKFAERNFGSAEYRGLSPVMKESFKKIIGEHLDDYLQDIENETLVIFGKDDKETPLYMAKRLNNGIKNSKLSVYKGAGHFCFIDKPCKFNLEVREFLLSKT